MCHPQAVSVEHKNNVPRLPLVPEVQTYSSYRSRMTYFDTTYMHYQLVYHAEKITHARLDVLFIYFHLTWYLRYYGYRYHMRCINTFPSVINMRYRGKIINCRCKVYNSVFKLIIQSKSWIFWKTTRLKTKGQNLFCNKLRLFNTRPTHFCPSDSKNSFFHIFLEHLIVSRDTECVVTR